MSPVNGKPIVYTYRFTFESGEKKEFSASIDPATLNLVSTGKDTPAEWTRFSNFKCPHCPLKCNDGEYCPVAVNLEEIIRFFSNSASYEKVFVEVSANDRHLSRHTTLQESVSGLIGIMMVASGCPVMGKLKPMVRFHMPFSSLIETEFRAMSMYMLGQFFLYKRGVKPDMEMQGLIDIYEDIKKLNQNVVRRIADIEKMDTSINSLVVLNNFADYVTISLDDKMLDEIELLYSEYL